MKKSLCSSLLKEMNSPEVRKGLVFALRFLKSLAEQPQNNQLIIEQ